MVLECAWGGDSVSSACDLCLNPRFFFFFLFFDHWLSESKSVEDLRELAHDLLTGETHCFQVVDVVAGVRPGLLRGITQDRLHRLAFRIEEFTVDSAENLIRPAHKILVADNHAPTGSVPIDDFERVLVPVVCRFQNLFGVRKANGGLAKEPPRVVEERNSGGHGLQRVSDEVNNPRIGEHLEQ